MTNVLPTLNLYGLPIAEHPVFIVESRGLRHARSTPRALLWMVATAALIGVAWALIFASGALRSGILIILFLIAGSTALLDIVSLLYSVGSFSREFASGRMDLLRMTPLHEAGIIAAKHAVSQARTQSLTLIAAGMRLGVLVTTIIFSLATEPMRTGHWFTLALQMIFVVIILCVFVLEPFWRTEMMTALGVYISSLNRPPTFALLTAGFSLGAVWLLGLMIVGVAGGGLGLMASLLLSGVGYSSLNGALLFGMWFNFLFLVLLCSAIYGFNHLIQRWCLRRALRRLRTTE